MSARAWWVGSVVILGFALAWFTAGYLSGRARLNFYREQGCKITCPMPTPATSVDKRTKTSDASSHI